MIDPSGSVRGLAALAQRGGSVGRRARRGLSLHADAAAVNVNFWITPDEANLNPDTGGLVVYDKEAPAEWNFAAYNSEQNKPKILE